MVVHVCVWWWWWGEVMEGKDLAPFSPDLLFLFTYSCTGMYCSVPQVPDI